MITPLDSIRAKFSRAKHHYESFGHAFDNWTDQDPFGFTAGTNPTTGWFEVHLVAAEPPLELALIFADFITNLRAALDQTVFHLTTQKGRDPNDKGISFPVVSDRSNWKGALCSNLRAFPEEWLHVVEKSQPFVYGSAFSRHPLHILHHVDIRNKHRTVMPIIITNFVMEPEFELNRLAIEGDEILYEPIAAGAKVEDGMLLGRMRAISKNHDLQILRASQKAATCSLHVGPASDVTDFSGSLPNLLVFVGSVIEQLAPAF